MDVYTPADLAKRWHCTPRQVQDLVKDGKLKGFYVRRLLRVKEADVEAFEQSGAAIPGQVGRGFIYFVKAGPFIKIGFATDVDKRAKSLATACPYPIEVIHTQLGSIKDESELHRRFAHLRAQGEWFRHEAELADFISEKTDK